MNNTNPPIWESDNKINTEVLENFGLNKNAIKVYNSLFILGRTKTGKIIKQTMIASSRVYSSLQQLIDKGLVSYQVINNVKYYQAELPYEFINDIEKNTASLKVLARELKSLPIIHESRNETNVFEGYRGLKMAYIQHTENLDPKENVCIIASIKDEFVNSKDLRAFFSEQVDGMMIKKKNRGRMLTNKAVHTIIKNERPDSSIYDIRHLSPHFTLPYAVNISRREVMMSVWSDNPIVFCIKNPVVVKAFQKNFDYLWDKSNKYI